MSYRPNFVPALTAALLSGVPNVNLAAGPYNAPLDGASHMMTQAAALAMYPNCGATAQMEQNTAAWYQCEYDIRTSAVRARANIWLPPGSTMNTQPLVLVDASRVGFRGDRHVTILTAQCGTTPAISVLNCPNVCVVLSDFQMQAKNAPVSVGNTGGVPHTGFAVGASALHLDNVQGINIERVGWNGYDQPLTWGNNVFGIIFDDCGGSGNNYGFSWFQTTSLNSMERIYFKNGSLPNNNYGFYIDATYGPDGNGHNQYAQGGSIFIQDNAIDYNIMRHGVFIGTPLNNTFSGSSLHLTGNHMETTGACSGGALTRIYNRGEMNVSGNECYENDSVVPIGFIEAADGSGTAVFSNILTMPATVPICYSSTAGFKRVEGGGNIFHDASQRPILLQDLNGTRLHPSSTDGTATVPPLFNDITQNTWSLYYGKIMLLDFFAGPGSFTLPNRTTFAFPLGVPILIINIGANYITIAVDNTASGATLTSLQPNSPKRLAPGGFCYATPNDTVGQFLIAGLLTV